MGTEGANFSVLPEGFIADILLTITSPPEVCRLSTLSKTFRSAAESDAVWEKFLPSDYQSIISRSDSGASSSGISPLNDNKKNLYFSLCDSPILIDGGMKSFSLDKWSGKKCYMIAARGLGIIWGNTPKYWGWISSPHSRFAEVAELLNVCWLVIHGSINTNMLSPETTYEAFLVCNFTDPMGFDNTPIFARVGIDGDESHSRTVYLDADAGQGRQDPNMQYPKERGDEWLEVKLGEYFNEGRADGELKMSLWETEQLHWKRGLIIQGIEIRPKRVINEQGRDPS